MLTAAIEQVKSGQSLAQSQMAEIVDQIMRGACENAQVAELLTQLHQKGETVEELTGAAKAMRSHMKVIHCMHERAVDTCGTGGSGKGFFNVSTAAAFVASSCGVVIAKHGNRKATSNSGSTDVLAELGIAVDQSIEDAQRCLNEAKICFCHAPLFHPSVKHVIEVRKSLSHPTVFNLLGPLCNPAVAPHQVLGAGRAETQQLIAQALCQLGTQHSVVVHGCDGAGEITCAGETRVFEVQSGVVTETIWRPADFGMDESDSSGLVACDPAHSAEIIQGIFDGELGPARDVVVMNAAAAVWISGAAGSLKSAAQECMRVIDTGAVNEKIKYLRTLTNSS